MYGATPLLGVAVTVPAPEEQISSVIEAETEGAEVVTQVVSEGTPLLAAHVAPEKVR